MIDIEITITPDPAFPQENVPCFNVRFHYSTGQSRVVTLSLVELRELQQACSRALYEHDR